MSRLGGGQEKGLLFSLSWLAILAIIFLSMSSFVDRRDRIYECNQKSIT